jgi:acyl carrier protein phosphodiesterase
MASRGVGEARRAYTEAMNLLAHALLSPAEPAVMVGNLTADWVKGRARAGLPAEVRRGMELHGRIDAFTDAHGAVERCAALLEPTWGRYAAVLVDVLFDHVLSAQWGRWSERERDAVIAEAYAALREHLAVLPARAQWAVHALLADDWLTSYATLDGMAVSLSRLSARLQARGHEVELAPAVGDFVAHREAFHEAFGEFFPELRREVERWAMGRVD